jgi:class 3 adenylate cyclase
MRQRGPLAELRIESPGIAMIQSTVVMFADVSGSSVLYKQLGDAEANRIVSGKLRSMARVIVDCQGQIIKTIGDEIMAHFPDPVDGLKAAIGIQNVTPRTPLIRIGMAWGDVLQKDNDLFGKTVNDAAAVAKIARGGQILTTQDHSSRLPASMFKLAAFDTVRLKGGTSDTTLYRIEWEAEDDDDPEEHTTLSRIVDTGKVELTLTITDHLGHRSSLQLRPEDTPYNVGRNPQRCQLIINAGFVSREHCHIDYQHGCFILRDHSSNGTHVIMSKQQPVYLRRNSTPLLGEGVIGVGHDPQEAGHHVIGFKV